MAPTTKKARTPKTPKAPRPPKPEGTEPTGVPGQSVKLANTIKKVEFIDRLIARSISAFTGAAGAESIRTALTEAQGKVTAALTDARALPATFRFGAGGGGFAVGAAVTVKAKHSGKYGTTLSGDLTVKEIGAGMVCVANAAAQLAWVPRAHLTRPEEVAA